MTNTALRIDRLLFFLRLAPARGAAQDLVARGLIRVNGRRVVKPAHPIQIGDVITLPLRSTVRVLEMVRLPERRGPASEAAACYREHAGGNESDSQQFVEIDDGAPPDLGTSSDNHGGSHSRPSAQGSHEP